MIFIYLACFFLLLYYLLTKNSDYWKSRGVPFEKPFLIFGSFYKVAARKQHIFNRIREIYESHKTPYVGIHIFTQPNLVIRNPELIKKILIKDFDKFGDRIFTANESVDPIGAHALFSSKRQLWKDIRAKVSPVFTLGKIKLMLPLMKECGSDLINYLDKHNGQVLEFKNLTRKYAVDIISSCAFGINAFSLKNDNPEVMEVASKLTGAKSFRRSIALFSYFFFPKMAEIFRFTFLDKTSMDYLIDMFNDNFKQRKEKKILRNDLVDLLINIKQNETFHDGYKFDDMKMAAQAILFFSAGNHATSFSIAYTLYELALNSTIQIRLRQEVQQTFEKHGDFSYEALQEMKYLDMVLNETLRKYPFTTFLNRKSTGKYTFEETGFTLEENVAVTIPVAGLHFDPEYFPDPEKYDPERFSDENKHKILPYTYMPFGDGPRNCIGQRFGILATKVALAYVIKDFALERTNQTAVPFELDPSSIFLLNKTGFQLRVSKI